MSPAPRLLWLCGAAVAVALVASPASAQRVGVSSAVNPATTGAPPGGAAKTLLVGENIVFNEHINTGPDGQTQVLFVDESAVSIGPNSDMTIDEFVYDPKTGTGTEALSATRGVFRYVGGKLSKGATPVTIKTAVATIGIRGGVFVMDLGSDGTLEVIFLYGNGLTITGLNGVTVTITRPGFGVTVNGRGAGPSNPTRVSGGKLASFINQLDGHSGGNGGASQVPTDTTVANSGVSGTVSGNLPGSVQQAIQSQVGQTQTQTQTQTVEHPGAKQPEHDRKPEPAGRSRKRTTTPRRRTRRQIRHRRAGSPAGWSRSTPRTIKAGSPTSLRPIQRRLDRQRGVHGDDRFGPGARFAGPGHRHDNTGRTPTTSQSITGTPVVNADGSFFYSNLALVSDPSKVGFVYGGQPVASSVYAPTGTPQVLRLPDPAGWRAAVADPVRHQPDRRPDPEPERLAAVSRGARRTPASRPAEFVGTTPTALQASLAINGTGPSQSSALVVAVANTIVTNGNPGQTTPLPLLSGAAEGSFRPDGMTPSTRINTTFQTGVDGAGNSFYGNNAIEGFVLTPYTCCNTDGSQIPALATATNTLTNAISTYGFVQPAVLAATPAIANGPQAGSELTGFFGGTMVGTANGTPVPYAVQGGIAITTNPSTMQIASVVAGVDPVHRPTERPELVRRVLRRNHGERQHGSPGLHQRQFVRRPRSAWRGGFLRQQQRGHQRQFVSGRRQRRAEQPASPGDRALPVPVPAMGLLGRRDRQRHRRERPHRYRPHQHLGCRRPDPASRPQQPDQPQRHRELSRQCDRNRKQQRRQLSRHRYVFRDLSFRHVDRDPGDQQFRRKQHQRDGHRRKRHLPVYAGTLSGNNLTGTGTALFFGPNAAETGGNFAVHSMTGLPYQAAGVFAGKKN